MTQTASQEEAPESVELTEAPSELKCKIAHIVFEDGEPVFSFNKGSTPVLTAAILGNPGDIIPVRVLRGRSALAFDEGELRIESCGKRVKVVKNLWSIFPDPKQREFEGIFGIDFDRHDHVELRVLPGLQARIEEYKKGRLGQMVFPPDRPPLAFDGVTANH